MSHVVLMIESCHTYCCVAGGSRATVATESCDTYE